MPTTLDNSSLAARLAANFKCGTPPEEDVSLELIGEVLASLVANGTISVGDSTTLVDTPSITAAIASGSVAAGAKSVSFTSSSDFVGTLLGVTFPANVSQGFSAQNGHKLSAIAFTMSAGTLYIAKVI